jgi:hypothetical protein
MSPDKKTETAPAPPNVEVIPEVAFRAALANPLLAKVFANHFFTVTSPTDLSILFGHSGVPTGIVSMPYSMAKTLAKRLKEALDTYEGIIGAPVTDAETLESKLREKGSTN